MHNDAGILRDGGILPYCQIHDMVIQAWSPLQMGYFEGVFLQSEKYAWILRIPAKMQVILGTTRPERVETAARAADICLTREEWYSIYRAAGNL
ncbi:hypothetical protein RF397_05230, partial [Acinetobacter baumannii]|nr:hypothetical protein [Acinetobacter baumannii]